MTLPIVNEELSFRRVVIISTKASFWVGSKLLKREEINMK